MIKAPYTDRPDLTSAPPLLAGTAEDRPPPALMRAVGPLLATFIHNYQRVGPIYRYYDGYLGQEMTALAGVAANVFITRQGRAVFGARHFRQKQLNELDSDKYLVGMDGEDHYRHRKAQTRGYGRAHLDGRYAELTAIVQKHVASWQPGQRIAVYPVLQAIITEQLGTVLLNYPQPEHWATICAYVTGLLTASFDRRPMEAGQQEAYRRDKQAVMALIDAVLIAHRSQGTGPGRPDLVDDLLAASARGDVQLTEQELRVDALTVYIAGIAPVVHTCTFMLDALLKRPQLLARVRTEVQSVLNAGPLSPALLHELKLLRYTAMEAMRMYPFAPVVQMEALEGFDFGGYHVTRGTSLIVSQAVAHFLPEIYADPYTFDIDRYRPERAEHRGVGTYAPFGVGHHSCLGAGFAEMQIVITMAALLGQVDLERDLTSAGPVVGRQHQNDFMVCVL